LDDSTVPSHATDDESTPARSHSTNRARSSPAQRGFGKPSPLGSILIELRRDVLEDLVDGEHAPAISAEQAVATDVVTPPAKTLAGKRFPALCLPKIKTALAS
jgi:hypothetical protein